MLCASCGRNKGRKMSGFCVECETVRKAVARYPDPDWERNTDQDEKRMRKVNAGAK